MGTVARKIATNTVVNRDELLEFITTRHHAIGSPLAGDGRPQTSPVTCGVDDQGRIVVATYLATGGFPAHGRLGP